MKKYIFYTTEGFTQDKDGNAIENCQVVGWSDGEDEKDAFRNLLIEYQYPDGFCFNEIMSQELASGKVYDFPITPKI